VKCARERMPVRVGVHSEHRNTHTNTHGHKYIVREGGTKESERRQLTNATAALFLGVSSRKFCLEFGRVEWLEVGDIDC
jgi:hypothetical protein